MIDTANGNTFTADQMLNHADHAERNNAKFYQLTENTFNLTNQLNMRSK